MGIVFYRIRNLYYSFDLQSMTLANLLANKKKEFERLFGRLHIDENMWPIRTFLLTSLQEAWEMGEKEGVKKASKEGTDLVLNTIKAFRKLKVSSNK